jgi:hypothetical protein
VLYLNLRKKNNKKKGFYWQKGGSGKNFLAVDE